MKRTKYIPPQAGRLKTRDCTTWQEVIRQSVDLELKTITTGYLFCPIERLINLRHPNAKDLKAEIVRIPIFAHVLKHRVLGTFLIDTGLDSSFQANPYGRTKGWLAKVIMTKGTQEQGQNAADYIRRNNITLAGVFLSHLHMDHMAGVWDLPKDVAYIVAKGEKPVTVFPLVYDDYLSGLGTLHEVDMAQGQPLPPFDHCIDIFGDHSLWIIATPGHTKHHISFFINQKNNPVLLTADACHFKLCLERKTGPGAFTQNVKTAQETLLKIISFKEQNENVTIMYGHG